MLAGNNTAKSSIERQDFDGFKKRNGMIVKFDISKIKNAVTKAFKSVYYKSDESFSEDAPEIITRKVLNELNDENGLYYVQEDIHGKRIPSIADVQDLVEVVPAKEG